MVRRLPPVREDAEPIPYSFEAKVPVVSLHVRVFGADGELTFENYGGVDLAHTFLFQRADDGGGLRVELRDPVLGERPFLREGVEVAFDPYLPRGQIGDW